MGDKQLLIRALKGEQTTRPAWVPFVGTQGGQPLGIDAETYLKSPQHIAEGIRLAHERYRPDGLPVVFDLQIEAEILGCNLVWAPDGPPSVASHPLRDKGLDELPVFSTDAGRFPLVKAAMDEVRDDISPDCALYGLICGPFTLALHLLGNDIFLQMLMDPGKVKATVAFAADVARKTASFYLDHGAEVIAVVDPMISQISEEHFSEFFAPYANEVFDHIRAAGGLSSLFVCGDATRNLGVMCATTCDSISIDENIPIEKLRDLALPAGKSFGGNLKLTTVLMLGSADDSRRHAVEVMDVAGDRGFILAPGCDLPYDTPSENLVAVAEVVHDEYVREVARTTQAAGATDDFADIEMPDYAAADQVYVDIITLDSASCAPCQYMVDAVNKAVGGLDHNRIVVREHKIKNRQGIGAMCKLGVQNVPTICIDGDVEFVSLIPDSKTLRGAITRRMERKAGVA